MSREEGSNMHTESLPPYKGCTGSAACGRPSGKERYATNEQNLAARASGQRFAPQSAPNTRVWGGGVRMDMVAASTARAASGKAKERHEGEGKCKKHEGDDTARGYEPGR